MKNLFLYSFIILPSFVRAQDTVKLNDIKTNITSPVVNNYHLTYERSLSKTVAVSLGIGYMPKGNLPFKDQFKKQINSDKVDLDQFQMGNFAITPECRFYLGKGYLHGFYIAVYGRYASFNVTAPIQFTHDDESTGVALFDGKINSFSGGMLFGMQYTLWKILVLDIMLIGGHYGSCSGTMNANNINPPLSATEQQSLQDNINTINAKPYHITGQVTSSTTAWMKASGPWAGIRSGINLGIRF
ncbi:MAG TPA: DUF3575 domain-containing protein [Puia sp.]|nr:DUF3575 domain-containing protein [Puia sp.]